MDHVYVTAPQGSTTVCSGTSSIQKMFFKFLLLAKRTTRLPFCLCMVFIVFGFWQSSFIIFDAVNRKNPYGLVPKQTQEIQARGP